MPGRSLKIHSEKRRSAAEVQNAGRKYALAIRATVWSTVLLCRFATPPISFSNRLSLFRRGVHRRLVFRLFVILDQPKSPADQSREIFGCRFFLAEKLFDLLFQLRLLIDRVQDLKDFH